MKKINLKLSSLILLSILSLFPIYASAALDYSGLVKCDGVTTDSELYRQNKCNFAALMSMVNSTINWLFVISIPIAVGSLAYAGFLYMTGSQEKIKQAKGLMTNVLTGFIIMLCAWFIVTTLLKWLVSDALKSASTSLIETKK